MADSGNANRFPAVDQLIEDSIGAHPQRVQPTKFSAQRITGEWVALEESEGLLDCIDQRPIQLEQVATGSPGENESRQGSAGGRPTLSQLGAKLGEGDRLSTLDLGKTHLQCGEGVRIREDLGGLLERLVLVYRNQRRRGGPIAGDKHVITTIADIVEQAAEVAAELSDRNGLGHERQCT